jgi:hypothetical protein
MNDSATIIERVTLSLEDQLARNMSLLLQHGQALEALKGIEQRLRDLDLAEANEAAAYAQGFKNDAPIPRDQERDELARLLAGARAAARSAELSIPPLEAAQREIRARIEAQKSVQSQSLVEQMLDTDENDRVTIDDLAAHILELLHRRKGLRVFLAEQGRALISKGDVQHGTEILRQVERSGAISVPTFELDAAKVQQAIAEIASRFTRRGAGQ